jgi:hypothetical protein
MRRAGGQATGDSVWIRRRERTGGVEASGREGRWEWEGACMHATQVFNQRAPCTGSERTTRRGVAVMKQESNVANPHTPACVHGRSQAWQ